MQVEKVNRDDGLAQVNLTGKMDASSVLVVGQELCRAIADEKNWVLVDLLGISEMTYSGIGMLLQCHRALEQRGFGLILVAPPGPVRDVLDLARLPHRVAVHSSLQEATFSLDGETLPLDWVVDDDLDA